MRTLFALLLACNSPQKPATGFGDPQRIVSQTVDSDEILWALGEDVRARVVGVSKMADDRRYSTVAGVWPETVPRIAGTSEAMIAARPDLVFVAQFTAAETMALLEHAKIHTVVMDGYDGFEDYRDRVRAIATAVGNRAGGDAVVADFDRRLAAASAPASPDPPTIISYVEGNVPGKGTTFDEEAAAAGFRNLPAQHGIEGHQRVSLEQIVVWNPDYIVVHCADDCATRADEFATGPGIASTKAAGEGHVLAIESNLLLATGSTMPELVARLRAHR
jgi:iron complex transport system substrate-binding protein